MTHSYTRKDVELTLSEFEECKKEYAFQNSPVDSGELFFYAGRFAECLTALLTDMDKLMDALELVRRDEYYYGLTRVTQEEIGQALQTAEKWRG